MKLISYHPGKKERHNTTIVIMLTAWNYFHVWPISPSTVKTRVSNRGWQRVEQEQNQKVLPPRQFPVFLLLHFRYYSALSPSYLSHRGCRVLSVLQSTGTSHTQPACHVICTVNWPSLNLHVLNSRHVYGQVAKRELCIDNVKLTNSAWDTNLLAASGVSSLFPIYIHSQLSQYT